MKFHKNSYFAEIENVNISAEFPIDSYMVEVEKLKPKK